MGALDSSLGVLFVGGTIAGILWGISCVQIFHYYTTRPKDSSVIKAMVAIMLFFTTSHQILIYSWLYNNCVTNFGNFTYLSQAPRTTAAEFVSIPITATIVQGLYVSKIWKLSHGNRLVTFPIIILCLVQIALGGWITYLCAISETWVALLTVIRGAALGFSAVSLVLDSTITFVMCWLLDHIRTEYMQTNSLINKLIVFIMSTNMLTALLQLSIVIVYAILPMHFYLVPMYCVIVQLYANSFMASLNMRPYLRQHHHTNTEDTHQSNSSLPTSPSPRAHVNIFKEISSHSDLCVSKEKKGIQWNGPRTLDV